MTQRKRSKSTHVAGHVYRRKDGSPGIKMWTPEDVISCRSREELNALLKHYSRDFLALSGSTENKRTYIERIRPALRFYCKKYGVQAPQWLQSDSLYLENMSIAEREAHFGTNPVKVREFKELKPLAAPGDDEGGDNGGSPRP